MNNIFPIFQFLQAQLKANRKTVLVTLVAVSGASTRNPGAHMAVSEDGSSTGSFSGGCVEAAVVAEALEVISAGVPREVRYGAGSPHLDIRLPCGGGIDLLFTPISELSVVSDIFARIETRQPVTITLDTESSEMACASETPGQLSVERHGSRILVHHIPAARVTILGHGPSVESLTKLSISYGIDCKILSPDSSVIEAVENMGTSTGLLKTPDASPLLKPDLWTACIFYFHDHDWEARLMKQALESPAFYIGAMGSRKTHEERQKYLAALGVPAEDVARMVAPIGLIPSTRDPATLALSTLAQVVDSYHRRFGYRS